MRRRGEKDSEKEGGRRIVRRRGGNKEEGRRIVRRRGAEE